MLTDFEILKAACGADENGIGKSIIRVETKYLDFENQMQKIEEKITLVTPVVNISSNMRHTIVDVIFESASDYDLVQLFEMLNRFTNAEHSISSESLIAPVTQVTIIPKELVGMYYINGNDAVWALTTTQVNRLPNCIRFMFDNDTFQYYNMTNSVSDSESEEEDDE